MVELVGPLNPTTTFLATNNMSVHVAYTLRVSTSLSLLRAHCNFLQLMQYFKILFNFFMSMDFKSFPRAQRTIISAHKKNFEILFTNRELIFRIAHTIPLVG